MKLIATQTVTSAEPSITFGSIPQTFTDLYLTVSSRTTGAGPDCFIRPNGATTNLSGRRLRGNGVNATSAAETTIYVENCVSTDTASTFSNNSVYFPNYTSSAFKSMSIDAIRENNATDARQAIFAALWSDTAAITSITIVPSSTNFDVGSTFSLYGIGGAGDGWAPKATGGVISRSGDYYVHTFTASGTFTPTAALSNVEYLVIAGGGGGGGGAAAGGGAGAGGYRCSVTGESSGGGASAESKLSLASGTAYTVTVGAGGSSGSNANGTNGTDSTFSTITSTGGGRGGSNDGAGGGSGGGGRNNGASGTANQGRNGGGGNGDAAGGGGGASANGGVATYTVGSNNGGGGISSSITGSAITRAGGGGGAMPNSNSGGSGGAGGGGGGGRTGVGGGSGTVNTGGGGGGAGTSQTSGAGGSGIVIVRYLA